jgi:mRNA interferase MazF
MPIKFHPPQGCVVTVDYSQGFREPEMVKRRLAVVLSPAIRARPGLATVVALSQTAPNPVMPFHAEIVIPFPLPPSWGNRPRWVKGDMVNAVAFHRIDLLRLGKDETGQRTYQTACLPADLLRVVRRCVLHGLGLSTLTKHL